jgi:cytolysin (calcineurin-like family phosphatase)
MSPARERGPGGATTFLFLSDTQANRNSGSDDNNPRVAMCSKLNQALNVLDSQTWPTSFSLTCGGEPIGPIAGLFFGGDMCATGGDYSAADQMFSVPPNYNGGWELMIERHLYEPSFNTAFLHSEATRTKYEPAYFGLGNHDIQTEDNPRVGWFTGKWGWTSPDDYWRFQMWNFICQMHTGVWLGDIHGVQPVYSVDDIDADGHGNFWWTEKSFNYRVDLGPLDVYQMHCYGGDDEFGRSDGLDWLKDRLDESGPTRPVIIVQHYPFKDWDCITPHWDLGQRDAFLKLLEPYDVIALLTGHIHNPPGFDEQVNRTGSTRMFSEFRPGSAGDHGWFALVRVTDTTMDVMFGDGSSGSVNWLQGRGFALPAEPVWLENNDWNQNYFPLEGGLREFYADTNELTIPPGRIVTGWALRKKGGNRLAPGLQHANPDGSHPVWLENNDSNQNYFPREGGLHAIYADLNPLACPSGRVMTGLALRKKGANRLALKLQHANPDGSDPQWIWNDDWNSNYFPAEQGMTSIYADTNALICTPGTQVVGIALRRKGGEAGNRVAPRALATSPRIQR